MTCHIRFARFRQEDFSLEDKERPVALQKFKTDELEVLLEKDSRESNRELANKLKVDQSTVLCATFTCFRKAT